MIKLLKLEENVAKPNESFKKPEIVVNLSKSSNYTHTPLGWSELLSCIAHLLIHNPHTENVEWLPLWNNHLDVR